MRKKEILKQIFDIVFRIHIENITDKEISSFKSSSHIILPVKEIGKKAKVIIYK